MALRFVLASPSLAGWIPARAIRVGWPAFSENQAQLAAGCNLAAVVVGGLVGVAGHIVDRHGDSH